MRLLFAAVLTLPAMAESPAYRDPQPQSYRLEARASVIDARSAEHPDIGFVFEKDGKLQDLQHAIVDTRVAPRGELVIWLMGPNRGLFDRLSSYGLHAIQVHYANSWFGKLKGGEPSTDDLYLSNIRLEAATGEDFSEAISIPPPDGMMERAYQFILWLAQQNPQGNWNQFLSSDGKDLQWEKVIIAGISHGSTTAARFAKHQKVARVVMFAGPRDPFEVWQSLPSATPPERYFGFTHVLDGGWTNDHYCRSWQMLGLQMFGPVVNIDETKPPYSNTRRLISNADVNDQPERAHSAVVPGGATPQSQDQSMLYEDVWRYLFTHPVESSGDPVPPDPQCEMDLR